MSKSMKQEWDKIKEELQVTQHMRGREVISEIIELTKNFGNMIDGKFQKFKDDDEEGYMWK